MNGRLWNIDLDGDGRDELLTVVGIELLREPFRGGEVQIDEYRVRASRGGVEKVLWEWTLPGGSTAEILEVQPRRNGQPATVVVRSGRTVYSLAGPTGKPVWRVEDPWPAPPAGRQRTELLLLGSDDPRGWPRVVFSRFTPGNKVMGTVCRSAWPTLHTGQYAPSEGVAATSFAPLLPDPRFDRPLPWILQSFRWEVILPLGLAAGIYVWSLRQLARRRRWKKLVWLIIATLAASLALCMLWMNLDTREVGSSRYAWSGWYWGVWVGICAMGTVVAVTRGIGRFRGMWTS